MARLRLRLVAFALAAVVAVAVVLLAWRGEAWLRDGVQRALQARFVPAVELVGPVSIALSPQPRLRIGPIELREAGEVVLRVEDTTVDLAVSELLRMPAMPVAVSLRGVDVSLRQRDDGRWSAAAWLKPGDGEGGAPLAFGRVLVEDATVHLDGAVTGRLEAVRLSAGPVRADEGGPFELAADLVLDAPRPVTARVDANGQLRPTAEGLDIVTPFVELRGNAGDWAVNGARLRAGALRVGRDGTLSLETPNARIELAGPGASATLGAAAWRVAGAADAWRIDGLSVDVQGIQEGRIVHARVSAPQLARDASEWAAPAAAITLHGYGAMPSIRLDFVAALTAGAAGAVTLSEGRGALQMPHPAGGDARLAVPFETDATADPSNGTANGTVTGGFDESSFAGGWRFDAAAARPFDLGLNVDRLDLDRYLPPAAAGGAPPDLTAWQRWPVTAELRVGRLRVKGFDTVDARLRLDGEPRVSGAK